MAATPPEKQVKDMSLDELRTHFIGLSTDQLLLTIQTHEQYIEKMKDGARLFASLLPSREPKPY